MSNGLLRMQITMAFKNVVILANYLCVYLFVLGNLILGAFLSILLPVNATTSFIFPLMHKNNV